MMRTLPKRLIAFTLAGLLGAAPVAGAAPVKITATTQRDVMVTVYNGNLGLVKDVREVRLDRRHSSRCTSWTWPPRSIPPPCTCARSPTRPGSRSSSRTTSTTCCRARSSWRSTWAEGAALPERRHLSRRPPCSRPAARCTRSTARSTWATTASSCCRRCPRTSCPSRRSSGCSATTRPAPQRVEASYLTGGITWKADYVMVINAADDAPTSPAGSPSTTRAARPTGTPRSSSWRATSTGPRAGDDRGRMEMAAKAASPAAAEPRVRVGGLLRVPPLHPRRPHHDQGQARPSSSRCWPPRRPGGEAASSTTAPRVLPHQYGMPMSNQKVGVYLEIKNTKDNRLGMPLPKGKVRVYKADPAGQPAAHRRGLDRPHAEGRAGEDQDGRRLRRGGRARAEGLAEDRRQSLRGRVGDRAAQPQEGGEYGRR